MEAMGAGPMALAVFRSHGQKYFWRGDGERISNATATGDQAMGGQVDPTRASRRF